MIPVRLALTNFMCYGSDVAPLCFEAIHTACITGDNGSGKSALIDAITWALWGQARTRSGDDLVKSGEREMTVIFDFRVADTLYRVIRKHARPARATGSGRSALELQVADGKDFRAISESNATQTQQKICAILHMDYDTFINSALLLQGHADEFTRQTPARRKEVLAGVLGLDYYDELENQAKEKLRELDSEKLRLETAVSEDSLELEKQPGLEAVLSAAQAESTRLAAIVKEQAAKLDSVKKRRDELENKQRELSRLANDIGRRQADFERWRKQAAQHRSHLEEYRRLVERREVIEQGYLDFTKVKKLVAELEQKLRAVAGLNERKHRLEMAVYQAQQALNQQHAVVRHRLDDIEKQAGKIAGLEAAVSKAREENESLLKEASALEEKKQVWQERRLSQRRLEEEHHRQEKAKAEIDEKIRLLLAGDQTHCPLCETELGSQHVHIVEEKYRAEKRLLENHLLAGTDAIAHGHKQLAALEAETGGIEVDLKGSQANVQERLSTLNEQLRLAREAASQIEPVSEEIAQIEARLASRDYAAGEQRVLTEIDKELVAVGYDGELHERERQRLTALEKCEAERRKLEEADRLFGQAEACLREAEAAAGELWSVLEVYGKQQKTLVEDLVLLPEVSEELARVEAEHRARDAGQRGMQEKVVELRTQLTQLAGLKEKIAAIKGRLEALGQTAGIYRDLQVAFGKRGVPAMLIETALPEIENEANQLLSRMTDGRMSLRIETQRATKAGDIAETLDIKIADELGTRDYEMFSGGEAFRINFALRIALSRLVARRAEAPLPTLIIDEGFGTQDAGGLEKVKEAINSIQDDFKMILVISHIEDLKEQFDARIEVVKTASGSNIKLS